MLHRMVLVGLVGILGVVESGCVSLSSATDQSSTLPAAPDKTVKTKQVTIAVTGMT